MHLVPNIWSESHVLKVKRYFVKTMFNTIIDVLFLLLQVTEVIFKSLICKVVLSHPTLQKFSYQIERNENITHIDSFSFTFLGSLSMGACKRILIFLSTFMDSIR